MSIYWFRVRLACLLLRLCNISKGVRHDCYKMSSRIKKRYWGQHLWARGYFCATVGDITEEMIRQYIENQPTDGPEDAFQVDTTDWVSVTSCSWLEPMSAFSRLKPYQWLSVLVCEIHRLSVGGRLIYRSGDIRTSSAHSRRRYSYYNNCGQRWPGSVRPTCDARREPANWPLLYWKRRAGWYSGCPFW